MAVGKGEMAFFELVEAVASDFPYIGYIETSFPTPTHGPGGLEIGTGTLIAPCVVLTAGHIVFDPNQGGQADAITITLGGPGGMSVTSNRVDFPQEWRNGAPGSFDNSVNSAVDLGVIVLPEPIDQFIAPVPFQTASDSQLAGMSLNVAGYPAAPSAGTRGTLWGRNSHLLQGAAIPGDLAPFESYRLFYPVSTLPGMSGGPLYDFNSVSKVRTIRGIHTAGPTPDSPLFPGSALRITEDVLQLLQHWVSIFRPS